MPLQANPVPPELVTIYARSAENMSTHGDSIVVVYNQDMIRQGNPPKAGGMQDINNIPSSQLKAPAEYPLHKGNATKRNTAKNYQVKITPAPHSKTQAFNGTWYELGGIAIYPPEPGYMYGKRVLLKLEQANKNIFEPGDTVEITVSTTVESPDGLTIPAGKNRKSNQVS